MLKSDWALILNPRAKGGKAARLGRKLINALAEFDISFKLFETGGPGGGEMCALNCIDEGYRNILVAGGDGSVYDVLNGLLSHPSYNAAQFKLAVYPIGTGNDFARFTKMPFSPEGFAKEIKAGYSEFFDAGKIVFGSKTPRYFINVAGLGFDAQVAERANIMKKKGFSGVSTYVLALLTTLFRYREIDCTIELDGKSFRAAIFTLLVGNGTHAGNGMRLAPDASPQDGYFHVTCVTKISRRKIVANIHRIFSGNFKHFKEVEIYKSQSLRVFSNAQITFQADGELLQAAAAEFKILPNAIQLVVSDSIS